MKNERLQKLVLTALFTAITCIFTMVIRVPTIGTAGYVNIGDSAVLLCAWILSGWYGAAAAGVGSAMADMLSGYPAYIPGTFLIKFLMAGVAILLVKLSGRSHSSHKTFVIRLLSAILAEIIMVAGYLFYESTILGYGAGALGSVYSNTIQGITNIVLGLLLITALEKAHVLSRIREM